MRDQNKFELDLVNCPANVSDVTDQRYSVGYMFRLNKLAYFKSPTEKNCQKPLIYT